MPQLSDQVVEVLLVEDNSSDEEMTLRALKKANVVNGVHVVRDGEEALEYLFFRGRNANRAGRHAPRVVLLDLKLPKVNGLQVLRDMKASAVTKTIPVVVLTSSSQDKDVV